MMVKSPARGSRRSPRTSEDLVQVHFAVLSCPETLHPHIAPSLHMQQVPSTHSSHHASDLFIFKPFRA